MSRSAFSVLGLVLLAGLPILVLAAYAWSGLRAERRAILADAHDDGRRLAMATGKAVDGAIQRALEATPPTLFYPMTPVPGFAYDGQEHFDIACAEGDIETLRRLRDETPADVLSRAGIPVSVLAAWEIYSLEKIDASRERLRQLVLDEAPSVLTPLLLERAGVDKDDWQDRWRREERVRRLLRNGSAGMEGPLVEEGRLVAWLSRANGRGRRVLLREEILDRVKKSVSRSLPDWMSMRVRHEQETLFWNGKDVSGGSKRILANYQGSMNVQAVLSHPDRLWAPFLRQRRWTLTTIAFATLASGIGLTLTLTALRRAQHVSAMKSQFVASVSHELRAPVASMRLMAEALESGKVDDPAKAKSFHRLMAGEGARLASMVENVLDFARIEQGRKSYHLAETDVEALLRDALALLEPQAETKGIHLQKNFQRLDFEPLLDGLAVQQAVINLLDNAVKFSPEDSTVTLALRMLPDDDAGGAWSISVSDEGSGIDANDVERIFERFTRLENELQRETQGAGIGLSLVKHVAEGHGGSVGVESTPGQGSTFTLRFPPPQSSSDHG